MFSHQKSKLDLFAEMNAGKVILIDTAKDLLKENGTEVFGRFFIALIANAAQERATLHPSARLPCFVYIDEFQEYIDEEKTPEMLQLLREYNVGVTIAHQNMYAAQLNDDRLGELALAVLDVKLRLSEELAILHEAVLDLGLLAALGVVAEH